MPRSYYSQWHVILFLRIQMLIIYQRTNYRPVRPPKKTAVLGKDTLAQVHEDIRNMILPSWIGRVPNNLGSASHGSLSADQWRTACTVNLVTSLVRMWGTLPADDRRRLMLDNFMNLVLATKLVGMRIMTKERSSNFLAHMLRYLEGVKKLFPEHSLLPYHHMSLHFPRFLEDYGPTHGWRCFPFERYNYLLQQIPTNLKFGAFCDARS